MLIGQKVILEEIDPANVEQLRQWRNDPSIRKYFREWRDISKDKQDCWYKDRGNNINQSHIYFQIMERMDNSNILAGSCGLHYIDWRLRSAEFGCFLAPEFIGQGLGKEALVLLFDYGFKECNFHKIWCEVYDNNTSINLYKKIGFKEEGILRDNYFHEGRYGNSTIMSILECEWREKYGDSVLWEVRGMEMNK